MYTNHTNVRLYLIIVLVTFLGLAETSVLQAQNREYNGLYEGPYLNRVAFPIGGIGAGMICLEGTGAISKGWFTPGFRKLHRGKSSQLYVPRSRIGGKI